MVAAACGPRPGPDPEPPGILSGAGQVRELTLSTFVGCETEATLELTNMGGGPLALEAPQRMSGNLDFVEVRGGGPGVLAAGETRVVTLAAARLEDEGDHGPYSGRLRLGGEGQWLEVEVNYSSAVPVVSFPEQLHFGAVTVGDSFVHDLTFRNPSDAPTWHELGPLTKGDPGTFPGFEQAVRVELEPEQEASVPVTFSPTTPGAHLGLLRYRMPLWCREFNVNLTLTGTGVE